MTTDTKLNKLINAKTGIPVHRFPRNLGSSVKDPESKKFCMFEFATIEHGASKIASCVVLPFPEINDAINVTYDNAEFDVAGAIAVGAAAGNINIDRLSNIAKTGISSFNPSSFARIASDVVLSGTPGLKAGVAKGLNTIQNPYVTSVFNSVGFRDFSFSFVLMPKNSNESNTIKQIIETFKHAMLPEKVTTRRDDEVSSQSTGILTMPDKVNITFFPTTNDYSKENKNKLVTIKNAVIQDFTVEYSAGTQNPIFFKETNAPLTATLNVTIKETEIYTRERCIEDYGDMYKLTWKTY